MSTFLYSLPSQLQFSGLRSDQRTLVEHVQSSHSVHPEVRRRASALVLLDEGRSLEHITEATGLSAQGLSSLVSKHARHGVRVALLGRQAAPGGSKNTRRQAA